MKDPRFVAMRNRAERDLTISYGALRLLLRLVSNAYTDPHFYPDQPFPLPWSTVGLLCGKSDPEICYRRIYELLPQPGASYGKHRKSYLKRSGEKSEGCPPTRWFKFNL